MDTSGLAELLLAAALSSVLGFEREIRHKAAGLRTHTLVGVGAALFTLAGRYGFDDAGIGVDPTRIAAQVVTGIGFIGAGVIFLRRDTHAGVRGLTTAATIWLAAAVGLAAGAGLTVLALGATAVHLVVMFVYTPVVRRLPASRHQLVSMEVRYHDGRGVLRRVIEATTELGYLVSDLDVDREGEPGDIVAVAIDAEGKGDRNELLHAIERLDGVERIRVLERPE